MKRKQKTPRQLVRSGPGNYFISIDDLGVRIPNNTVKFIGVSYEEPFDIIKIDWRTIVFKRGMFGETKARHYDTCVRLHCRALLKEHNIKYGRYQLCHNETTKDTLTFKLDISWK